MEDGVILADNLNDAVGARHAFFTKQWGVELPANALAVRARMAAHLRIAPQNFLFCRQTHSPKVVTVDEIWTPQNAPQADAMVTNKTGIALGIRTADCVPVLFACTNSPIIAAAHAGWRGALCGVLENTVAAMENLGAQKKSLRAALGPCIWKKSYEVGPEFPAAFLAEDPAHERFFTPTFKSDNYQFDLSGYVVEKLHKLGVLSVEESPADTCADPERFYSYRASTLRGEECSGRLVSAIAQ
jgi:YfiH family protein